MSQRPLSLSAFQAALAHRLDELGPDGLRVLLERRAAGLRPAERQAFLALLDPVESDDPPPPTASVDRDLVAFADAVAAMPPSQRWRWRERWDDDEDEPLPAEGADAEDLLVAIGERFLAGDVAWAAGAYEQVFRVIASTEDDDRDIELGVERALATEARNRWLWAIASSEPAADVAGRRMAEAVELSEFGTDALVLDDIVAARPGAGPIADEVLRAFAAALTDDLAGRPPWDGRRRLTFAFEIGVRLDGVDVLVDAARSGTAPRLETYRWLVAHLSTAGELERAAALGDEALAADGRSYDLAGLADDVALLWLRLGRPERALAAQCRSWVCRPTVVCLERVLDAADSAGRPGVPDEVDEHPAGSRFLQAAVALLAGRIDEAIEPVAGVERQASHDGYAADRLAVAAACHGAVGGSVGPTLRVAVAHACRRAEVAGWYELERSVHREPETPLGDRLVAALDGLAPEPARLAIARQRVDVLAERVLGAKDRPAYETVAILVVLLAQTTAAVDGTDATVVTEEYDQRYRRFSAFRGELREVRAAAGLRVSQR